VRAWGRQNGGMPIIPTVTLNDGTAFPELGLGTYNLRGAEGVAAIVSAIESGYRLLDTAVNYENEREVGEAVRASGVDRGELLVATKIPGRDHGYDEAIRSTTTSLAVLGLDYLDLSLIHWPNPSVGKYVDTWRAMIDLRERGVVRSIGVSNFTEAMLTRLMDETGVVPSVNQVELHPYFPQGALRGFHAEHGIRTESWSPLARRSELLQEQLLIELAEVNGVTPTQVVLRWHVQLDSTPIPKSADPERQRENADVFDFALTDDEVSAISALERGRLWDGDPNHHEEM
jgi:2,5-diketo-D-gluconate reductase A